MFEKRRDLYKFLVVAKTGAILTAANKLSMTQPALSRTINRLEEQFKGQLFERLPSGVRLTRFGSKVAVLSEHILQEIQLAEDQVNLSLSGRTGYLRITAGPMWMKTVVPAAVARFHGNYPGMEVRLRTTSFMEGVWLLMGGESDLHCGGIDGNEPLPEFLAREHVLDMTWCVAAHSDHPLHGMKASFDDLAGYPWIDFDSVMQNQGDKVRPSPTDIVLAELYKHTDKRVETIIRADSVDLSLMETGAYLSVLSMNLMRKLPGRFLEPLPLQPCRHSYPGSVLSRKTAVSLAPCRQFIDALREVALE